MKSEKTKSPVTAADLAKNGYREQYGVIIICKDESEQKRLYEKLLKQGHKLRVVVT
jgi:hypothetical protein